MLKAFCIPAVCLIFLSAFTNFRYHDFPVNISSAKIINFPVFDSSKNNDETCLPEEIVSPYDIMHLDEKGLSRNVFDLALKGYNHLIKKRMLVKKNIISIIDYSQSSDKKRLYVIDIKKEQLLFQSLVAHGRNCGLEYAKEFSNEEDSHKSSLGFYVTMSTYTGECGYALKLKGCEKGFNDKAYARSIVMHGSDYVNENFIKQNGYLGRSLGCPALPKAVNEKIIGVIKKGSCLFVYYPAKKYLLTSHILNG